ncbi:MAG TPA: hypothetical protein VGF55_29705, partial [Gemmataceae bacterium]
QTVDPCFSGVYAPVMRVLGPVLPSNSRSASDRFRISGVEGWWRKDEFGRLTPAGTAVLERDPETGWPLTAIGPDLDSLEPMIKQLGSPPVRRTEMLPPSNKVIYPERATLHWGIEVGALKAVLLTFDHLLRNDPERFTRSAALAPVRAFVRAVVEGGADTPDVGPLASISLGVQYDPEYLALYAGLRDDAGLPAEPFRHTLLVSANPATRTLDAVFWAFETDPHGFRLATEWPGGAVTYVMTNGILVGQEVSQAVRLDGGYLLGRPTGRRCRRVVRTRPTAEDLKLVADELTERRHDLYRRAVDYVEQNSDGAVREQLGRLARLNANGDHRLSSAVFSHLTTLFADRAATDDRAGEFLNLVSPILDAAAADALPAGSPENATPAQGWEYWLDTYRRCLDVLREPFGLPGHAFRARLRTVTSEAPAVA